jgi:hypothetical protein
MNNFNVMHNKLRILIRAFGKIKSFLLIVENKVAWAAGKNG